MQQLLLHFARHPLWWLAALTAASLLAATQLDRLQVRIAADEMLVVDDPQRLDYRQVRRTFGDEQVVLVVVADQALAAPDRLARLRDAVAALEALPFVARTDSLFNVPHVRGVDGFIERQPYLAEIPADAAAAREILAAAARNPLLRGTLVSADGEAMAVAVVLAGADSGRPVTDDRTVAAEIDSVVATLRGAFDQAYAIGFSQVRSELAGRILGEQAELLPLAIGALLLALFLMLRQLTDILTPLITAGVSVLWTFGLMGWLGIPVNVVTSTVPILLIVVGSTEDIHLLAEFRHAQHCGDAAHVAMRHMARRLGRTVLLTFLTTYAGFLSVGLSGIEVLRQFGFVASTGLLFNFIVTIVFVPAFLSLTGGWRLDGRTRLFEQKTENLAARYWSFLIRHRRRILYATGIAVVIAAAGIPRIDINHNPADSLGSESPTARHIAQLNQRFAGLESFSVIVESGIQDTFLQARYLDELLALQRHIQDIEPGFSVTSFVDYLSLLNTALLEDPAAGPPRTNEEIAELMLFLDQDRVDGYVTGDYSGARILVRHQVGSTDRLHAVIDSIQDYLDTRLDPGLRGRITGDSVLTLSATESLIEGQLQSILLILFLFIVIVSLLFTDLRVGLLAALPNMLPMIVLFGFMGYADIPLNIGTAMAAAIAIGIAVDDTLHFMLRYNQELRTSRSQGTAMQNTLYHEGLPVIATSFALILGFAVFALSDFVPVAQFGLLSALVIGTALLADFIVTPLAISALRLVTLWDLLSSRVRQHLIPNSPLFRDMRPWQIRKFVLSSTLLTFRPGEYVYRQSDPSNELYLVMQGVVEITVPRRDGQGADPVVDQFGPGEVFGDVALLAEEARKTNALALSDTTLLVLTRDAIHNVTLLHPFVGSKLFLNLARDVSCRWVAFIERIRGPQDEHDDTGRRR